MRYAQAFADWLDEKLVAHDTHALVDYRERAPEAARAHPTEEHLLPLHVAWGAAGDGSRVERVVTGFEAARWRSTRGCSTRRLSSDSSGPELVVAPTSMHVAVVTG